MPFPSNIPWPKVLQAFDDAVSTMGTPAEFTLKTGEVVEIMTAESWRQEQDMTSGLYQEVHRCRFLARDWTGTRPPEKGDRVRFGDRNYAVMHWHSVQNPSGAIAYVVNLTG
jgi:hypothetical protein